MRIFRISICRQFLPLSLGLLVPVSSTLFAQQQPPIITADPRSQSASSGANVTFRLTASGTPPLNFQWILNDQPLANATNSSLGLSNVQVTHAGTYSAIVANSGGAVTSAVAVLTIDTNFT